MLWFFDRDEESLRLETRYDNDTAEVVVTVHHPDGHEHRQRFADNNALQQWLETFELHLTLQHWTGRSGPVILPYGWLTRR
jgi:hypothetical protein